MSRTGPWTSTHPTTTPLPPFCPTSGSSSTPRRALDCRSPRCSKALSAAAHAAGLAELVAELRRWRKAHAGLRRTHIGALQHQLAEEVAGESLGEPHRGFPGMPELSPEQLIAIFMYGETLHRDAEKAAQVEAWDSDPLLGPLMRQEVRADAQAFVHFYGAFAGYVARWLEVADAQVAGEGEAADADG